MSHDEGHIVQYLLPVYGLGEVFHREYFVSDLPVGAEVDVRIFSAGRLDLIQLNLFQGTLSGGSLLGLGSVCGETGDELLQLLDLFFLLFVGFLHLLYQKLTGFKPEIIVAGVELDFAVVDVCGMGADLIQEVTVVGDHDNRVFKVDEEILQPGDGVQVKVVGGLVQQQNVRIAEQGLCQQYLNF